MTQSRRTFLKTSAAIAAASLVKASNGFATVGDESTSSSPLNQFGYGDVDLLEGPLREQFDRITHSMPRSTRTACSSPIASARASHARRRHGRLVQLGAAEDIDKPGNNGFAPCHSFGQYLSALSRDYAATGDRRTQEKVHRLVSDLRPRSAPHFWDDNRFPAYTYDKISIGMIDAHEFAGDPMPSKCWTRRSIRCSALAAGAMSRAEQYARPHTDESFCWDEPYTLPENPFLACKRGAGSRYRDLAIHFLADSGTWIRWLRGKMCCPESTPIAT